MPDELRDAVAAVIDEDDSRVLADWMDLGDISDAVMRTIFAPENRAALVAELLERGVIEQPCLVYGGAFRLVQRAVLTDRGAEMTAEASVGVPLYQVLGVPKGSD